MELSNAEKLVKDRNKKYPAEIINIINSYLSGNISRGRLAEFFDEWVDLNLLQSAQWALKDVIKIKKIIKK